MKLSDHFTLAELCVTNTGLPNTPDGEHVEALIHLCRNVLEPVRAWARTKKPDAVVIVNSGFRSYKVNAAAGSKSTTSQHLFGEAADIEIPGIRNDDIYLFIRDELKNFDQLIAEKLQRADGSAGWIHVSYRVDRLRREAISFLGNKYVPGLQYVR